MIGQSEWEQPWTLTTPEGTLPFNVTDIGTKQRFQLVPAKCTAVLAVRASDDDDIPQGDGKTPHRRWRSGFDLHLGIELLSEATGDLEPACDADLVEMLDLLGLHMNAMVRTGLIPGLPNARLSFTPSGQPVRLFDRCQLNGGPIPSAGDLGGTVVDVDIDSPYPYYISSFETATDIADATSEDITNGGNTDFFPVFRVYGPFTNFNLQNAAVTDQDGNPLVLVYDSALPGAASVLAGDYIEFSFFRDTAYLNGDQDNMKAGIDMRYSDFFPLAPGVNPVSVTFAGAAGGTLARCLSNDAWA